METTEATGQNQVAHKEPFETREVFQRIHLRNLLTKKLKPVGLRKFDQQNNLSKNDAFNLLSTHTPTVCAIGTILSPSYP